MTIIIIKLDSSVWFTPEIAEKLEMSEMPICFRDLYEKCYAEVFITIWAKINV